MGVVKEPRDVPEARDRPVVADPAGVVADETDQKLGPCQETPITRARRANSSRAPGCAGLLRQHVPEPGLQEEVPRRQERDLVGSGRCLARGEEDLEGEEGEEGRDEPMPCRVGRTRGRASRRYGHLRTTLGPSFLYYGHAPQGRGRVPRGLVAPGWARLNNLTPRKKAAGLRGQGRLSLHSLRHGYASLLIGGNVNPQFVSRQMGHANPSVTLGVYAHEFARRESGGAAGARRELRGDAE